MEPGHSTGQDLQPHQRWEHRETDRHIRPKGPNRRVEAIKKRANSIDLTFGQTLGT